MTKLVFFTNLFAGIFCISGGIYYDFTGGWPISMFLGCINLIVVIRVFVHWVRTGIVRRRVAIVVNWLADRLGGA
jgi:hypothetical protein